jgi:AcrR family transcriptional regulator
MVMRSSTLRNEIEARFPEVRDKLNEDDGDWTLMHRLVEWLRDFNAISTDIIERLRRFKRWCEEQPRTEREDIWTSFIRGFWDNLFESNSTRVLIPQLMSRGEVTNEEILEAEKAIAHIRNDLTVLTSTTDVEKLVALVNERFERMICSFGRLRLRRRDWPNVFMSIQDLSRSQNGLAVMMAMTEMAQRHPDYKVKLLDAVAKQAPLVDAILDKVAQVVRALKSPASLTDD